MKKLGTSALFILLVSLALYGLAIRLESKQGYVGKDTLNLYNWGDYIDPSLLTKFEEETDFRVVYETFDSNEAMYTKIQQGGTSYDLAIPSEYMINRMIEEDLVLPIQHERLEGFDNIDETFLDLPFDPGNAYSVPYFWGTLGIIYNEKLVPEEGIQTWEDLWSPTLKNNVLLIDSAREVMGLTLQNLGYSLNSKNPAELKEASEKLDTLMPNVKAIVADEIKMYMIQEEAAVAVSFSGEAADMIWENENLTYVVPKEGSNLWFDNLVIPRTATNLDAAYAFINFMLKPENAAQNAEYIGYSTPNKEALKLLPDEIVQDEQFYPSNAAIENMEVYENLGPEYLGIYNDLYLEFKMN